MFYFNAPVNYLINSYFNPIMHFYDSKNNEFVSCEGYDRSSIVANDTAHCLIELPFLEKNINYVKKIFYYSISIDDYCFIEEEFNPENESLAEFAERTHLKEKYADAKEQAIPLILENWIRKNDLNIDWSTVTFT